METKQLLVGVSDFKYMVTSNYCYVDKTLFIKEVMDKGDKIRNPSLHRIGQYTS